jgi:hypothetical protein
MNEPILPSAGKVSKEWLADKDLGGKFFVQRIALDLAGRDRNEVARAWVDSLVNAIRKHDNTHLITVGVIPWAHVWPNAKPLFYSPSVSENLDFVSVHFYPKKGKVDVALAALEKYDIGKPLVVEEMFPLGCGIDEMVDFIVRSKTFTDGWLSFYWGTTPEELGVNTESIKDAIIRDWLLRYKKLSREHGYR